MVNPEILTHRYLEKKNLKVNNLRVEPFARKIITKLVICKYGKDFASPMNV